MMIQKIYCPTLKHTHTYNNWLINSLHYKVLSYIKYMSFYRFNEVVLLWAFTHVSCAYKTSTVKKHLMLELTPEPDSTGGKNQKNINR
jgi:hypothetical protein